MIRDEDVEISVIDTKPKTGMVHAGTYPHIIEITHIRTGVRVSVSTDIARSQLQAKNLALQGVEMVLVAAGYDV